MGLFDGLAGQLGGLLSGGGGEGQSANIVGALTGDASGGGISGMLETLAANGLAEHVASWTGDGQNLSVSPDQIRDALGSDQAQQMAQASGLPLGDFLKHLADQLPAAASATQDP
jgi:uncharacterized protein YidB (DUF937 family)